MTKSSVRYGSGLALIAIIAAAIATRLYGLGATPLWSDEALTLVLSELHILTLWLTPADPTPPIYYTIHKLLFENTVPSAFQARLPALMAGVLGVIAMYLAGRMIAGGRAGLIAALLLVPQTYHVIYSQQARTYSLLFLLILLSATSLIKYLKDGSPVARHAEAQDAPSGHQKRFLVYYVATAVIALYTHYTTVYWTAFSFAALVFYETARAEPGQRASLWWRHGIIAAIFALTALPALWLISHLNSDWTWLTHVSFTEMLRQVGDVWFLWEVDFVPLDLLLMAAVVFGLWRAWRTGSPAAPVITALLLVPLALWLTGFFRPMLMERTILFSVSGVILALALALEAIPGRWLRLGGVTAVVLLYGVNTALFQQQSLQGKRKQNWDHATQYLAVEIAEGDMILLCGPWVYPALRHASGPDVVAVPTYGSLDGVVYRMGNWDKPEITWPEAHTHYLFGRVPGEPPSVLQKARTIWGFRVNCEAQEKTSYDGAITALGGQPTTVWTGYDIIIDRITLPTRAGE